MGDATLEALGAHCGELRGLKLWAVEEVTCAGVRALARGCHRLEAVDLRACEELDKSMARSGEGCLVALAEACPELRELRLKPNGNVGDATLSALGAHCPRLETLDASGAHCTDNGLRALAAGCPQLRELFVAGCKLLTDAGVGALAKGCPQLRLVDLQGCSAVGDAAALKLAEGCAALDTVSFQCCPWLGDEGFRALCARCPLRHITLKHCAVTQEAIDQAEQAHPQLQIRCVQSGNRL